MKNQFKKSLSLVMAVLMLMSCWVWVAPEKASAGVATPYYMKITTNVTDTGNEDGSTITINYKDTNGTGSTGTFTQTYGQMAWDGQVTVYSGPINGWPTSFSWQFNLGGGRTENHRDITVYIGGTEETCTHQIAYSSGYNFVNDLTGTDYLNCTMSITGTAPYFNEITSTSATDATVNKLPDGAAATSTVKVTGGKDQYGVAWAASLPTSGFSYSLKYTNDAGNEVDLGSTYASVSSSTNSATVNIYDDVAKLFPDTGSGKIYAYAKYKSSSVSSTINLSLPNYTMVFDANGGKIGATDGEALDQVKVTKNNKLYYNSVIGKAPAYGTKDGFDLVGFYADKNADATGLNASFTGTKFVDDTTTVTAQGDKSYYYAAWKAKPITATFVTADNQVIGTVEGRYNNNLVAENMYNGLTNLNAAVKSAYTGTAIQFDSNNAPVYKDGSSTYTFSHWKIIEGYNDTIVDKDHTATLYGDVKFQAVYTKADATKYAVKFYDGNGNVINDASNKSDYKFRDSVILPSTEPTKAQNDKYNYEFIGWANELAGVKFFAVDENDKDENGAAISYTSKDAAEFTVRGDASYVPVFRMIPREYKVTYKYTGDGKTSESTVIEGYKWDEAVRLPEIKNNYTTEGYRYYLTGWKVEGDSTDTTYTDIGEIKIDGDKTVVAVYGSREAAKYTINFYGKDADGEKDILLNGGNNIYEHNTEVTVPEVPKTIDTEDSRYTFAGWSPEVNTTASGDADYYATYTKKDYADLYFYNYDGELIYSLDGKENTLFAGYIIPEYKNIVDGENVLPSKKEDPVGTYKFLGWADGSGNAVVPGTDKFTGDTYLYAQFETVYKDYTVKFLNDDGTVVSEKTYHFATEIEIPENPTKAADETYTYDFRAWTPDVSEVCYGDATYTATYRRSYNYYKVTWLKDNKTLLSESSYIHGAKIQPARFEDPVSYGDATEGHKWVFKHWVQCDANGNDILVDGKQVIFARGMKMGIDELYFYPVFEEEANNLTVTFYKEDGTKIGDTKVPYGAALADYSAAFEADAYKKAGETHHYSLEKWVNVNGGADVITVTADVSVKPSYTAVEHSKVIYELIKAPTCTETGLADMKCEDDACDIIDKNVVLAVVPDEGVPTGQIYVGTDMWKSTDTVDFNDVKYIGPNTNLIVNAADTGTRSMPWNTGINLISRGVGKIEYYIYESTPEEEKVEDTSTITEGWTTVYDYEAKKQEVFEGVLNSKGITTSEYEALAEAKKAEIDNEVKAILATYVANATGIASNLNLVNGKEYIIYIRVSDREVGGQSNKRVFCSGKLHYGTTAPEITVEGDGFGTKFCADATIKVTDDTDGVKAYIDDAEITLAADGTYKCETKGVHTVTAIDKNGNKTMKTFEIKGGHTYRNYTIAADCEHDGSKYDICTVCGAKAHEEVLPAIGHSYKANYTDKAATCLVDGYRTYVCDNNCGEKLVLNPTDDADKIGQAMKFVAPAEGETEGKWVKLTAEDIKHLKATGEHTYAKVKDENGEDTSEDAWVIDKAATCTVEGSKHRDCTVCGVLGRETATIPVDTENGHKFYRATVPEDCKPTCTEIGKKVKTCRYCGVTETVEYIDALGHVAGEYVILVAATCEAVGSKMLTCSRCEGYIGKPDAEGKFDPMKAPEAEEIPALGHAYKVSGSVYQGDDGKYYQDYVCANDSTHKESRVVEDYEPPVPATVTFDFNGGYFVIPAVGEENQLGYIPEMQKGTQTISANVGETISADEVEKAVKQDNATKKFSFSHWATKNADGTYTEVKFPIEVTGDATYYAVYAEKYINYTITYYIETVNADGGVETTEYKKTGYIHNGETVTLIDGPAKAATWQYNYKFAGWKVNGGDTVYTDTVTINGANINLTATYEEVLKKYVVTYAITSSNTLETFEVDAGSGARACPIIPVKAYDSKYHYEFDGWNKAEQLKKVESNIYTTPVFASVKHAYVKTEKTPAACGVKAVYTYTCECGHSYEAEEGLALEHLWGDPVFNVETGKNVITCQRENCGITQEDTRTLTAKFFVNETDANAIKTISYIPWDTVIDSIKLPADPAKEADEKYEYTFAGWAVKGTTDVVKFDTFKIKQDYEFVAVFEKIERKYNVIFRYDGGKIIKTYSDVVAGSDIVTEFTTEPTKAYTETDHYVFSGWKGFEEGKLNITIKDVTGDMQIIALFDKAPHSYKETTLSEATCKNGKGTRYICECGHYKDVTGKPLPHEFEEVKRVEASATANGYIDYKCKNCEETKREELIYKDNTISIAVNVSLNGAPKSGIQVEIQPLGGGEPIFATTNSNGVANFKVDQDSVYVCWVVINGEKKEVALESAGNGNLVGYYSYTDVVNCSCACHRDNIWGAIFRFFHKMIKLFTGEFKCCTNPDPMYG